MPSALGQRCSWIVRLSISALVFLIASNIWSTRLQFKGIRNFADRAVDQPIDWKPIQSSEFASACNELSNGNWMILLVNAQLSADATPRGFLETGPESSGIFLEYDPLDSQFGPVYRLGIGGHESPFFIPIRTVRADENSTVLFSLHGSDMRVVTNGVDQRFQLPDDRIAELDCTHTQIGTADSQLCSDCRVSAYFQNGSQSSDAELVLDTYSNVSEYRAKRTIALMLTTISFLLWWRPLTAYPKKA
jgi:hypothetical protein